MTAERINILNAVCTNVELSLSIAIISADKATYCLADGLLSLFSRFTQLTSHNRVLIDKLLTAQLTIQFSAVFLKIKVHYHLHKSPLSGPTPNGVTTIQLRLPFLSGLFHLGFSSLSSALVQSHSSGIDSPNNVL